MIDLSGAKVGDKFLTESEVEIELVFIANSGSFRYVFESVGRFTSLYNKNGTNRREKRPDITSKIDQRPWLKDMPNANVFKDKFKWLACDEDGEWYIFAEEPGLKCSSWDSHSNFEYVDIIKMPTLTGEQWKDSLISIDELREWQEQNK